MRHLHGVYICAVNEHVQTPVIGNNGQRCVVHHTQRVTSITENVTKWCFCSPGRKTFIPVAYWPRHSCRCAAGRHPVDVKIFPYWHCFL